MVPPVELHQVQPLDTESAQGAVDDVLHVRPAHGGQRVQVGHELGVDLERSRARRGGPAAPEAPKELFDAAVDVGAIEGRDAEVRDPHQELDHLVGVEGLLAMSPGELPSAHDEPGDVVPGRQLRAGNHASASGRRGTRVTSP